ncbi:hypothetical protein BC828DRAFT_387146 [Blastocladiella britannica]|nr:hypothetical protein BC828DRAFT_387146 [Blastocladiella britannica]
MHPPKSSSSVADTARHSAAGRAPTPALPSGIAAQEHQAPPSSARDLAVVEERLRSNLTYFRRRRQKYYVAQGLLVLAALVGIYGGFIMDDMDDVGLRWWRFYLRALIMVAGMALVAVRIGRDYALTMDQAHMFAPRVNRVLQHFNLAFQRPGHPAELSFSKRIPYAMVADVDVARQEVRRRVRAHRASSSSASAPSGGGRTK